MNLPIQPIHGVLLPYPPLMAAKIMADVDILAQDREVSNRSSFPSQEDPHVQLGPPHISFFPYSHLIQPGEEILRLLPLFHFRITPATAERTALAMATPIIEAVQHTCCPPLGQATETASLVVPGPSTPVSIRAAVLASVMVINALARPQSYRGVSVTARTLIVPGDGGWCAGRVSISSWGRRSPA